MTSGIVRLAGGVASYDEFKLVEGATVIVNDERRVVRISGGVIELVPEPLPDEIIRQMHADMGERIECAKRIEKATGGPPRNRAERRRAAKITQRIR